MIAPSKLIYTHNELKEAIENHLNEIVFKEAIIVDSLVFSASSIEVKIRGIKHENNDD